MNYCIAGLLVCVRYVAVYSPDNGPRSSPNPTPALLHWESTLILVQPIAIYI